MMRKCYLVEYDLFEYKKSLELQKKVLKEKDPSGLNGKEKEILEKLFLFDKQWDYFLTGKILKMISIFKFDVERIDHYVDIDTLFKYFYLESDVSLATIFFFIVPAKQIDILSTIKIGFVAKLIHTIRDLDEDSKEGIYNIPKEFKKDGIKAWVKFVRKKIREETRNGFRDIPRLGNFKYALVCIVNSNRYKWEFYSTLNPALGLLYRIYFFKKIFLDIFIISLRFLFEKRR